MDPNHIVPNNIQLIVYYEIPLGQRDEVKRKFDQFVTTEVTKFYHPQ